MVGRVDNGRCGGSSVSDEREEESREAFLAAKDPEGTQYKAKHGQKKEFHKTFHSKLAKGGDNKDVYIVDPKLRAKKATIEFRKRRNRCTKNLRQSRARRTHVYFMGRVCTRFGIYRSLR